MSRRWRGEATDRTYQEWHREDSLRRFLTPRQAWECAMIDLDSIEWCSYCNTPLALIEVKHVNASTKATTVLEHLASRAMMPAFLVEFDHDDADVLGPQTAGDCTDFWLTQVHPGHTRDRRPMGPQQFAEWLHSLRFDHFDDCADKAAA